MRAELADGRILEFPDGTDPAVIQKTVKKMLGAEVPQEEYDPYTFENIAGSAVEPLMTLATGAPAMAVGGLAGLGAAGAKGLGYDVDPAEVVRKTQEALTYEPRTGGGQIATEAITYPFQKLHEFAQEGAGQKVLELTGSPELAAATSTGLQAIPMALGAKYAPKGQPHFPKTEAAIKWPVTYPAKLAGKGASLVAEAIRNRLPGGTERTAGQTLREAAGPREAAVVEALMKAKEGETAGQAAVPAGAYEFSALQKMAEARDPSKFGAIKEGQQAARVGKVGEIARTPEELVSAIKSRSAKADPLYEAARKAQEPVNTSSVISAIDEIVAKSPGNPRLLVELRRARKGLVDQKGNVRANAEEVLSTVDGLKAAILEQKDSFIKGKLTEVKDSLIDAVPGYREAQNVFREASVPINEMQVGNVLKEAIEPRLGIQERAAVFANAIKNAKLTLKKSTGEPRFTKLDQVLKPEQVKTVDTIISELNRDATLKYQAGAGNKAMNEVLGTMFDLPKVTILERSIVIMNALLKKIEGKNTKMTLDKITEVMSNPKEAARLMKAATPEEAVILKKFKNQLITGSAIGAAENQ